MSWNSFENNYTIYIKAIERMKQQQQQSTLSAGSVSISGSSGSASSSSAASSTASSPTAVAKEVAAPLAATAPPGRASAGRFMDPFADAFVATQQQLQQRFAAAAYQQQAGQAEFPVQSLLFYQQQQHLQQQQLPPGIAQQQQLRVGVGAAGGAGSSNTNMANSLIWQPWRDFQQAAAMHRQLYTEQQQQQLQMILHKGSWSKGGETQWKSHENHMKTRAWPSARFAKILICHIQFLGKDNMKRQRERERGRREEEERVIVLCRVCCWGSIEKLVRLLCHIKHTKYICRYNKYDTNDIWELISRYCTIQTIYSITYVDFTQYKW